MTSEELQTFLEKLKERRTALLDEGDFKVEPNRTDATTLPDEDEQPLNEMNQVIASRRNKQRADELAGITRAIRAIHEDPEDFGYCEDCGDEIPIKRLELMPWAQFCVKCKSKQDDGRGYKRSHAGDYLD